MNMLGKVIGLAFLLLIVVITATAQELVPIQVFLQESLKTSIDGWRFGMTSGVCELELMPKESLDVQGQVELNTQLGFYGFHLAGVSRSHERRYHGANLDYCTLPSGGVYVTEAAPKTNPADTKDSTSPTFQSVPLPNIEPAGPDLIAGLIALVGAYAGWIALGVLLLALARA